MENEDLSVSEFRHLFPAFGDGETIPESVIAYRLLLATEQCGRTRWGKLWKHGCYLYTAHFLAVSMAEATNGQGAGSGGQVSSMSADGLSVSFDTSTSAEQGAGFFNATSYGREFWRLRRAFGAGGLQL